MGNQHPSLIEGSTTRDETSRTDESIVYSPNKYREIEGIKDRCRFFLFTT